MTLFPVSPDVASTANVRAVLPLNDAPVRNDPGVSELFTRDAVAEFPVHAAAVEADVALVAVAEFPLHAAAVEADVAFPENVVAVIVPVDGLYVNPLSWYIDRFPLACESTNVR